MSVFHKKLLLVIGDVPFTRWAKDHGIDPSTMNEWINNGRVPRSFDKLVQATGKPKEWWLNDDIDAFIQSASGEVTAIELKTVKNKQLPSNAKIPAVKPLVSGSGNHSGGVVNDQPKYNMEMSGVQGAISASADVVNEGLLDRCYKACVTQYGDAFVSLSVSQQIGYATDLYNKLCLMSAAFGFNLDHLNVLEHEGIVQQLQTLIKLNQVRKFPPEKSYFF